MKVIEAKTTSVSLTSMRDVRVLLQSNTPAEKVADYKWRSSEEIAFYLQGLRGGPELAATTSLDRAKLTKAYADLVSLQSRLDTLVGLDVAVTYDFRKHKSRLAPMVAEVRKELEQKRDRALRVLQKAARKNEPEILRLSVANTASLLGKRLASHYQSVTDYVYATAFGKNGLEFNHYIQIDGLHNPYVDYTYPEYYVVLTARTEESKTTLHVNTLHEFRAPGSFSVGDSCTPEQLETVVTALLHADEFIAATDGAVLPEIPLDVRQFNTPVQNLAVQKNCVQGEFHCAKPQAIAYSKALLSELYGAFAKHIPGYVFKCRLQRRGTDRWTCSYIAVPQVNNKGLDAYGERVLKDQLNFTPEQIVSVRRLLLKGH